MMWALVAVCLCCCGGGGEGVDAGAGDSLVSDLDGGPLDCSPGLVEWPQGGCGPAVDDCLPGQFPVLGGGCMTVGTRACPRKWNLPGEATGQASAQEDCEPGERLPCPEGFAESEDSAYCFPLFDECENGEVPLLGGGCERIGPQPALQQSGAPFFDACPEGLLALPGGGPVTPKPGEGGCAQIGPRACPKLWHAKAPVNCAVGTLLPCPENWAVSDDGLYCSPAYEECGPGERPLPGGGCKRVIAAEQQCPDGPFPQIPGDAGQVAYVSAGSTCTVGCGIEDHPWPDISSALAAVDDGACLLVGAGVYDEGLFIDKPVRIVGLCAAEVMIVGSAAVPPMAETEDQAAGIVISGTEGVEVSGVGVLSAASGVVVVDSQDVSLTSLESAGAVGTAVYVAGSQVALEDSWIHDTQQDVGLGIDGFGIWAAGGSELTVEGCIVESTGSSGFQVVGPVTTLAAHDSVVRGSKSAAVVAGEKNYGVNFRDSAAGTLSGVVVEQAERGGLLATGEGTSVVIEECVVRHSLPDASGTRGQGVVADEGANVSILSTVVEDNCEIGVNVPGEGTQVAMVRTVVKDTKVDSQGVGGFGVVVGWGSKLTISGGLLLDNKEAGMFAYGTGTEAALSGTLVVGTGETNSETSGNGLVVGSGARLTARYSLVEDNCRTGVAVSEAGAEGVLDRCVIRETRSDSKGNWGRGVHVETGGTLSLQRSLLEDNREIGISLQAIKSALIESTVVRETTANAAGEAGYGVQAFGGGQVTIIDSLVDGNTEGGLAYTDVGTDVSMERTIVRNTLPDLAGQYGYGVQAKSGARLSLLQCAFEANVEVAVSLTGADTTATVDGTVVRDTLPNANGEFGVGLEAWEGAQVTVLESVFERNAYVAVSADDPGTSVTLDTSVVRDTAPGAAAEGGRGIEASDGSDLVLLSSLLERNQGAALFTAGGGTRVTIDRTVVRDTAPDAQGKYGRGLEAIHGCEVTVAGSVFDGNCGVGVLVGSDETDVAIDSALVSNTQVDAKGERGYGLAVAFGALATARRSLFLNNSSAGGMVAEESTLALIDSAVVGTRAGGGWSSTDPETATFHVLGDGLACLSGTLELQSVTVTDSERCGVFFVNGSGVVAQSVVTGNSSYGLALEDSSSGVAYADTGNHIFGNGLELTGDQAVDITTNPQGLPVPPVPEIKEMGGDAIGP